VKKENLKKHDEEQGLERELIIFLGTLALLIHNIQICCKERQRVRGNKNERNRNGQVGSLRLLMGMPRFALLVVRVFLFCFLF